MNQLLTLFDVNTTFFTIFGYPMSYIEFFGTLANLLCVYLIAKKNTLSWPVGIIGVLLFGTLFYQLNLYADMIEQGYYLITGFWGWYVWYTYKKRTDVAQDIIVQRNTARQNGKLLILIGILTMLASYITGNLPIWLPTIFPEAASLVVVDSFTTVLSFVAQFLLIKKVLENWVLWIVVDVIGIWLYWYKGVPLVAALYFIFLIIACNGLRTWYLTYRTQGGNDDETSSNHREVSPATSRA